MEWLLGIYLVIGVLKTLSRFGDPNPAVKPLWMFSENDPLKMAMLFTLYSLAWPVTR